MTTAIEMGTTRTGEPGLIDLAELLATRLLVQGNSGSGKSHLLRRLLEQSAPLVQQAIIDPEGDFVSLADQFGHVVVDAECGEAELQRVALRVRQHRVSVVLNLENLEADEQLRATAAVLPDPPRPLALRAIRTDGMTDYIGVLHAKAPASVQFKLVATRGGSRADIATTAELYPR